MALAGIGGAPLRVALVAGHPGRTQCALLPTDGPLVVGRAPPRGLCIEDRTLSREHARFTLSGDRVWVEDLGSKNGTFFAGRRVARALLEIGDEVVLGGVPAAVRAVGAQGSMLRVEGEDALRRHVAEEISRAREFRRRFALLLVRAVQEGAASTGDAGTRSWLETLCARLRPVDRLALFGPGAAEVLLPETGAKDAERIARELAAPASGTSLRSLVGVALYPEAGSTPDALFEAARQASHHASLAQPVQLGVPTAAVVGQDEAPQDAIVAGRAMQALLETVERVAASRIPVILHGETGTGKEVLARLIHERGPRSGRRMVRVNCGSIPKDLVESTLFGHERGAFTGASHQQKGVFEEAHGGTVFLDEIGELPPAAQAALLRVLEVGAFCRVGSSREIEVDVRVVAATHRDLEAMAAAGAFRPDLFFRLSGVVLELPPLRERKDEIEPLARRFLRLASAQNGRGVQGITPEALVLLVAYTWPGNLRELRNAMERAVVVASGTLVGVDDLPARVRAASDRGEPERTSDPGALPAPRTSDPGALPAPRPEDRPSRSPPRASPSAPGASRGERPVVRGKVHEYEVELLREALAAVGWSRTKAAQKLGMPVRTLSYRMQVLGIKKPDA